MNEQRRSAYEPARISTKPLPRTAYEPAKLPVVPFKLPDAFKVKLTNPYQA
jgi:hypothetical protein